MNLQVAHKALHRDKAVTEKSSSTDMVTETDREVEKLIVSTLKQKFPAHRWVSETKCVSLIRSIYNCVHSTGVAPSQFYRGGINIGGGWA